MVKHNLQFHIEDPLYFALLRKKAEYNCKTWIHFLYTISNLPVLPQQSEEDKAKCEILYEVLNKTKSTELKAKCQNKLQSIEQDNTRQNALKELVEKRKQLIELIDDPELGANRHRQCLDMLQLMDKVIENEENAELRQQRA
ncbi:MAG: hypothetical protein ABR985_03820 [Methanotrichaceae archaeon]|jgi:hypothetical protein